MMSEAIGNRPSLAARLHVWRSDSRLMTSAHDVTVTERGRRRRRRTGERFAISPYDDV